MATPVYPSEEEKVEGEFKPNVTQRVILATKAEAKIVKKSFIEAHKEGFIMLYSYVIGAALSAQAVWPSVADYLPPNINKIGLAVLTFLLAADKVARSKPRVDPQ